MLFWIATSFPADAQEDLVREAEQLRIKVEELFGDGRYKDAIPLAARVLEIGEEVLGPEHPDTANALRYLADLYQSIGAYENSEPLYQRALAIREKFLGREHPGIAESLNSLALLYHESGACAKAERLYQRALAIIEKNLGPEHQETAMQLKRLAKLYLSSDEYAKAVPLYQRALTIFERNFGSEHPLTAAALNELGLAYALDGDVARAEPLLLRALTIREKIFGPEHTETAASLTNLAVLYLTTGANKNAEQFLQRALSIHEKTFGSESVNIAQSLNSLAELYAITGEYARAEPLYQRSLSIIEKHLGPEHLETTDPLNGLAELYRITGAYTKAESLFERARTIREKALGGENLSVAETLLGQAKLYQSTGAYAKAESLYHKVLAIVEKTLGPEHWRTATSLDLLATFYFEIGAYLEAEPLNERVQMIDEQNALRFLYSGSESRKQQYIRQRLGHVSEDVSLSLIHPTTRSTALGLTSVLQYKGRVLDIMSDSLARLRSSVAPQDRAVLDQLATVAQEFSTLTYRGPEKLSTEAYRERLQSLARQQDELQARLTSPSAAFSQTLLPITLDIVRAALPDGAVLVEWFRYQPVDPKLAPSAQRDTQPRYVAYVLERTGEPVGIDVGEARPIEDLITQFRRALVDPTTQSRGARRVDASRADVRQLAAALSEKLIKPLRPYFSQGERLLISPDGALNLLPFAALLDEHGDYLAQHFEISYLTSGRDLLRSADAPAEGESVVLAAPAYGKSSGPQLLSQATLPPARSVELDRSGLVFSPLPGTVAESKALQSLLQLDAQHVLTGNRATEAQLRSLHGPRILHLATHGFFLRDEDLPAVFGSGDERASAPLTENPLLRSGLALAGANERRSGDADDGILTAAEVAQLDLAGTQLVVLSACETALGTVDAGEGVYGLRRALVLAGAQSQLVSLWKVDDAATQALMTEYYRRLLKGEGRAAALRSVQLSMLADPARQHPYYWAAFIPIGSWIPLRGQPAAKGLAAEGQGSGEPDLQTHIDRLRPK